MAYRIKLDGTSKDQFQVGLAGVTLDASSISAPWTWVFPASPGVSGYVLQTDGTGVLSWAAVGAAADSTVPYFIPAATTYTVNENKQALFATSIDVEGTLEVNGLLIEVD